MKAGRELDALVAEKVMGWKRWINRRKQVFFLAPDAVESDYIRHRIADGELNPHAGSGDEGNAPSFSADIKAAWRVVDKLMETMFSVTIGVERGACCCDILRDEGDHSAISGYADTAPLAICLASLKACGVEIPA